MYYNLIYCYLTPLSCHHVRLCDANAIQNSIKSADGMKFQGILLQMLLVQLFPLILVASGICALFACLTVNRWVLLLKQVIKWNPISKWWNWHLTTNFDQIQVKNASKSTAKSIGNKIYSVKRKCKQKSIKVSCIVLKSISNNGQFELMWFVSCLPTTKVAIFRYQI